MPWLFSFLVAVPICHDKPEESANLNVMISLKETSRCGPLGSLSSTPPRSGLRRPSMLSSTAFPCVWEDSSARWETSVLRTTVDSPFMYPKNGTHSSSGHCCGIRNLRLFKRLRIDSLARVDVSKRGIESGFILIEGKLVNSPVPVKLRPAQK